MTKYLHNFWWWYMFLMILAPLKSWDSQLSNGAKINKNGYHHQKLWTYLGTMSFFLFGTMPKKYWYDGRYDRTYRTTKKKTCFQTKQERSNRSSKALTTKNHDPLLSALAFFSCPAKDTVTSSPGSAHPQIGATCSRCSTMWSPNTHTGHGQQSGPAVRLKRGATKASALSHTEHTLWSTKIAVTSRIHCYLIRMLSYRKWNFILGGGEKGEVHTEKPVDKNAS